MTTVRCCLVLALLSPGLAAGQNGSDAIVSVPPAEYRPAIVEKAEVATLKLAEGSPAHRVELLTPAVSELAAMKAKNSIPNGQARRSDRKALAVGFGRDVPRAARNVALSALTWMATDDGGRSARIEIRSPNAAALRVALQLPAADPYLTMQFAGSGAGARVFDPVPADIIAQDMARFGQFWSPVLEGDTATIELHAGPGVATDGLMLALPRVSHHVVTNAELRSISPKTVTEIGLAQSCNIDLACIAPTTALSNAAKSVAQLLFNDDDGNAFLCTGTLLNDLALSKTPYLLTAGHCMTSASAARTLDTIWFFDSVACNSHATPAYVQLSGGAALLARSQDRDWALLRLNQLPPAGAWYSAWNANPVPQNALTTTLHHPLGDLKKWAQGHFSQAIFNADSTVHAYFNEVLYSRGITEGGSSGAALLTLLDPDGYYEVRGALSEGNFATCPAVPGVNYDEYSRMEDVLPLVRQYLTPFAPNPAAQVAAVEFYNQALDHYFLTANSIEINDLDTGVFTGWERTGLRFLTYVNQAAGMNPVCRFYRAPAYGDSHFYSASPAECAATAARYPDWINESSAVFYIQLPDARGACPAGTRPLWRFFNKVTVNHRYTAEVVIRDQMRAKPAVWIPEGYGRDQTVMCASLQ